MSSRTARHLLLGLIKHNGMSDTRYEGKAIIWDLGLSRMGPYPRYIFAKVYIPYLSYRLLSNGQLGTIIGYLLYIIHSGW